MQELALREAVLYGMRELNGQRLLPNPQLVNDFNLSSNYSGAIALPLANGRINNGYQLIKFTTPETSAPNTTFENLWECTKERYDLTALTGIAAVGSIPVDKVKLGHPVVLGAGDKTNLISHYGLKFFPRARLPGQSPVAQLAKATFGTIRIFGIIGRAMPFTAVGLAIFDVVSIGMCAYEARHGK